jgi:hypothetical protein
MTRETRFRVFVVLALLAGGVAFFAVEIAATFAAPVEARSAQWWFRSRLGEIGRHVTQRKTFDPAASQQSNAGSITGSSTERRPAPVDSGRDEILRLLQSSSNSGLCTGEAAQTTRPDVTPSSNSSSAIGLRCRLDRASPPR